MAKESYFDGGLLQLIGWSILGSLITSLTLGICYPWALCMVYGWKINHTVVQGKRLQFDGSAMSLFGQWVKWLLLLIVTLGIYGFWLSISLEKWKVANTSFQKKVA
ncbi:MAG: YjgN family protein [Spirochaetaceae bacterium]